MIFVPATASPLCSRTYSAPLLAAQRQLETANMATAESSPAKLAVMNEREIYDLTGDVKKDLLNYLDNITSDGDSRQCNQFRDFP
jgi:hypothetical protein